MEDEQQFWEFVMELLRKAEENVHQDNNQAKINLTIKNKFSQFLKEHINKRQGDEKIILSIKDLIDEPGKYDLRSLMSNEICNQVLNMGYKYCEEKSNASSLFYHRIEKQKNINDE